MTDRPAVAALRAEPSPEAIEAAAAALGYPVDKSPPSDVGMPDNRHLERVRAILRAAYAVDSGAALEAPPATAGQIAATRAYEREVQAVRGEAPPEPSNEIAHILHQHMYVRVLSMQPMIGGVATHGIRCACGWESHGHPNEGFAGSAWVNHVAGLVRGEPGPLLPSTGPTSSQSADVSQDRTDLTISERRPVSDSSAPHPIEPSAGFTFEIPPAPPPPTTNELLITPELVAKAVAAADADYERTQPWPMDKLHDDDARRHSAMEAALRAVGVRAIPAPQEGPKEP